MSEAARDLERHIGWREVAAQLPCSRATAYRLLREAVGRNDGALGILRCPLRKWESYLERRARCGATNRGSTRSDASGRRGSTLTGAVSNGARGSGPGALPPSLRVISSKPQRIPPAQPRKRRQ